MAEKIKEAPLIVAIGASAGGLEALELLFTHMPSDTGMAFIIVVHLDPTHISLLPELLQRKSQMKVETITNGMIVEANNVYVIPPNKNVSIVNGKLQLVDITDIHHKLPINFFLKSLAQDQGSNAIAVILSGTGSDGSQGIKEVKSEAGRVIAQSVDSAKYDGMPKNAIATGVTDWQLAPEMIATKLIEYSNNRQKKHIDTAENSKRVLHDILLLIHQYSGHDFSRYKKNTINRRIERRMQVHKLDDLKEYEKLVRTSSQERGILFRELLIGVTSFFRDDDAFKSLINTVLPDYLTNKPDGYTIRVWIPGCSSGEEAYSIAISLHDCLAKLKRDMSIQIFATDIDERAIAQARGGLYPSSSLAYVEPRYRQSYFSKEDNKYRIKKAIRESIVFAIQDLIKDPPFTKLDLISCRNLLIYLSRDLQKQILPIFHYSLKKDGILFLGPSETTGQSTNYFEILDKKWKLFKRKPQRSSEKNNALHFTETKRPLEMEVNTSPPSTISQIEELSALHLVETILRQSKVPHCVVIDSFQNIVYVHGHLGHYLEPAEGRISTNILEMTRTKALKSELSTIIDNAARLNKEVTKKSSQTDNNGHTVLLEITVKPLADIGSLTGLQMVTFRELVSELERGDATAKKDKTFSINDPHDLKKELERTRESLQTTIEELETSNEELKSSNEELQSTNEELQSTNEELETSKEELQSLNEESVTVNAELQSHIDELSSTNDDIKNLLDSTQIATIFLDTDLKIRRYTPKMTKIINLVTSDINRPIADLSTSLQGLKLSKIAEEVLKTLDKTEQEVFDEGGHCYRMKISPYRTANNVIDGVVMSFEDITTLKNTQIALNERQQRYKSLFDHCPVAILEVDISRLVDYIKHKQLNNKKDVADYLVKRDKSLLELTSAIKLLNINDAARLLFINESEVDISHCIEQLINAQDYVLNLFNLILNQKDSVVFESKISSEKDHVIDCEITITVPKLDNVLNLSNTIVVVTPI